MAAIMGRGRRSREGHVEANRAGDRHRDLTHLDGVGEAGAEVIIFRSDENLTFAGQSPKSLRVMDPVEISFETGSETIWLLRRQAVACPRRAGRATREVSVIAFFTSRSFQDRAR